MVQFIVDASQDLKAVSFGREILSGVPKNAIVFAQGDKPVLRYGISILHSANAQT